MRYLRLLLRSILRPRRTGSTRDLTSAQTRLLRTNLRRLLLTKESL